MGVTIDSKNYSIDLGYFGFNRLRLKVAQLVDEEIGVHYKKLAQTQNYFDEEREKFFEKYNRDLNIILENKDISENILDFLYESDCNGTICAKGCEDLYEVIKDYDDDILYGYVGHADCAKFEDFKRIVKDCIENNYNLIWF